MLLTTLFFCAWHILRLCKLHGPVEMLFVHAVQQMPHSGRDAFNMAYLGRGRLVCWLFLWFIWLIRGGYDAAAGDGAGLRLLLSMP